MSSELTQWTYRDSSVDRMMLMMTPSIQAGISGPSIDVTSHDWCRPNTLIDIRMTVSHDWRNGVYGAEWGSFLQVPTVDDKQVDPRAHAIHSFRLWRSNLLLRIHPTRLTSYKHKWSCLHTYSVPQQWLESNESLTPSHIRQTNQASQH